MTAGEWTDYRLVTDEDKKVAEDAYEGREGFNFEPIVVSTQVVGGGVNYHFIGTAGIVYPQAPKSIITVRIFKPSGEKPIII